MRLCPVCKVVLINTVREEVDIDYCPTCKGVWLDRNELDKIIQHVTMRLKTSVQQGAAPTHSMHSDPAHHTVKHYPPPTGSKSELYMEEIFDFED